MPGVEFFTSWISYLQSRANWGCEFIFSLIDRTMEYITSIWLGLLISAASWCYQCCFLSAEVCCWSYCSSFIFGSIQIRSLSPIWISVFFFFFFRNLIHAHFHWFWICEDLVGVLVVPAIISTDGIQTEDPLAITMLSHCDRQEPCNYWLQL